MDGSRTIKVRAALSSALATVAVVAALLAAAPGARAAALGAGTLAQLAGAPCIAAAAAGCATAPSVTAPAGVAVSPDGRNVYLADPTANSVAELARGAGGKLSPLGSHACVVDADLGGAPCPDQAAGLGGATAVAGSPDGEDVYVASASSGGGAIAAFARGADGSLTPIGCVTETGGSNCGAANTMPGLGQASALVVSPDGRDVYVVATGSGAIAELARHPDGSVTPLPGHACIEDPAYGACPDTAIPMRVPVALAISPDGANVYASAQDASADAAVVELRRDSGSGALEQAAAHPCVGKPAGCAPAPGIVGARGVAASPDGRDVYVAGAAGVAGTIAELARGAGGALTPLPGHGCIRAANAIGASCPDVTPVLGFGSDVAVSADGRNAYAAGSVGSIPKFGVVGELGRDPASGALRAQAAGACVMDPAASLPCPETALGLGTAATGIALAPGGATAYASGSAAVVELARGVAPVCHAVTAHGGPVTVPLPCGDLNGDPLMRTIVAAPAHGTLGAIDQAHGTVVYTPAPGFSGTDAFSFAASDGANGSLPAQATVVVPAKPPGGGPGGGRPPGGHAQHVRLSHLRISPRRFHVRSRHGRRRHGGARVRFHVSAAARVHFTIFRERPGRRAGRRCVAPRRHRRSRARRCTRDVRVAAFTRRARGGTRRFRFSGRVHGRALQAGTYRLRAVPRAAGRAGKGGTARFAIIAPGHPHPHRTRGH